MSTINYDNRRQLNDIIASIKSCLHNVIVSDQDNDHENTLLRLRIMISSLSEAKITVDNVIKQIENKQNPGVEIKLKLYNAGGIDCLEKDCPLKHECANHETAGDFRNEDGLTPDLYIVDGHFFCKTKKASESPNNHGALVFKNNELVKTDYWDAELR